jgi:hypothetical protein
MHTFAAGQVLPKLPARAYSACASSYEKRSKALKLKPGKKEGEKTRPYLA